MRDSTWALLRGHTPTPLPHPTRPSKSGSHILKSLPVTLTTAGAENPPDHDNSLQGPTSHVPWISPSVKRALWAMSSLSQLLWFIGLETSLRPSDSNKPGLSQRKNCGSQGGPGHRVTCICVKQHVGPGVWGLGQTGAAPENQAPWIGLPRLGLGTGEATSQPEWMAWRFLAAPQLGQAPARPGLLGRWGRVRRIGLFLGFSPEQHLLTSEEMRSEKDKPLRVPLRLWNPCRQGWQEREFVLKCHFPALRPELSMFRAPWMRPADALYQM